MAESQATVMAFEEADKKEKGPEDDEDHLKRNYEHWISSQQRHGHHNHSRSRHSIAKPFLGQIGSFSSSAFSAAVMCKKHNHHGIVHAIQSIRNCIEWRHSGCPTSHLSIHRHHSSPQRYMYACSCIPGHLFISSSIFMGHSNARVK